MLALLVGVALLIFVWLAEAVAHGHTQQFDDRIRLLLHGYARPVLTYVMRAVSVVGAPAILIASGAVLVFWYVRTGRRQAAFLFAITLAGAEALDQLLKLTFERPRPAAFFGLAVPASYSFPSGHALVSFAFFVGLATLPAASTANRPRRTLYYIAAALPIAAIGFSRVYLGVHYPTDVLGGYAAAAAWLSIVYLSEALTRR